MQLPYVMPADMERHIKIKCVSQVDQCCDEAFEELRDPEIVETMQLHPIEERALVDLTSADKAIEKPYSTNDEQKQFNFLMIDFVYVSSTYNVIGKLIVIGIWLFSRYALYPKKDIIKTQITMIALPENINQINEEMI